MYNLPTLVDEKRESYEQIKHACKEVIERKQKIS